MIQDRFCDIYSSIIDRKTFLKKIRFYSLLRWITRLTANIVLPTCFRICHSNTELPNSTHQNIIVSLTSFPARIDKLWIVIECMFRQTVLPNKIILWLSKEQFQAMKDIPARLIAYQTRGLDIRLVEHDYRSHKKYLYTLQQYPNDILITIDDDLFYRSTMIEELMAGYKKQPKAIIAHYTHNIQYDKNTILPYNQWQNNVVEGDFLFFGSGGGTLFPAHSLHKDVCSIETALQVCPNADDVWLNGMGRLNNTPIKHVGRKEVYLPVLQRNTLRLFSLNEQGGNDSQLKQLITYCIMQYHKNPFSSSL